MTASPARLWSDPGTRTVAPGVHRIPLPLPGDSLRAVNVYVIEDAGALTMVDAGWHRDDSWDALSAGLAEIGATPADVRRVLVTHMHHDHYGQAPRLRQAGGAVISLGRGEKRSFDLILRGHAGISENRVARLRRDGAAEMVDELVALDAGVDGGSRGGNGLWEPPDRYESDGAVIELRDRQLVAIETPGHTRGHLSFLDAGSGLLFAGDHVLPHITPSIGFEPMSDGLPLVDFLLSLIRVRDLPVSTVLPAHGDVFDDLAGRVEALLDHHATRLAASRDAVGGRERTALEVARDLPWTRRRRAYDELDFFNRLLAIHETAAHLDLLAAQGTLVARDDGGVMRYRLAGVV